MTADEIRKQARNFAHSDDPVAGAIAIFGGEIAAQLAELNDKLNTVTTVGREVAVRLYPQRAVAPASAQKKRGAR